MCPVQSKGKAEKRRGRGYRQSKSKRRNKILDIDPNNPEGNERAKLKEKKMEEKKRLNEAPKKQNDFIPKSIRKIMEFQNELKQQDSAQKNVELEKEREQIRLNNKLKKEKRQMALMGHDVSQVNHQTTTSDDHINNHHDSNNNNNNNNNNKKNNNSNTKETPAIISNLQSQTMTNRKLKNKMWSKMKKEKEQMKKIKKQLNQVTAVERSKLKKRKREKEESRQQASGGKRTIVIDDEEDILDDEDLLNINLEDDDLEDAESGAIREDYVEFGEQAVEPPKKLKKIQEKLEAKYEARRKFKMQQMSIDEAIKQRQLEHTRQKVLSNYDKARQKRMTKSEDDEPVNKHIEQLQNFSAKFGAANNDKGILEF